MQLSVIVPVYNGEKYLGECLESLTKQGFQKGEHEVLVINDGSTDNTESIIDEYCSKYDYFVKINKENGGVSSARNLGLDTAQGDYIAFIDGDDMFAENGYLPLLDICYKENLDAFYYGYSMDFMKVINLGAIEVINQFIEYKDRMLDYVVWSAIMKREIIRNEKIVFDTSLIIGEDVVFNLDFANATKRIAFLDKPLYFYRRNENGVISKAKQYRGKAFCDDIYYDSLRDIQVIKINSEKKKQNPNALVFNIDLSVLVFEFLLNVLKNKYSAKKALKDLKNVNVTVSDVEKIKATGNSFRARIKAVLLNLVFRHEFFYRLACFAYRVIK